MTWKLVVVELVSKATAVSTDPGSDDFELKPADLPHGLEGFRHILELDRLRWALWMVLVLALLLLFWRWWRKRVARRSGPATVSRGAIAEPPGVPVPEIVTVIGSLRERHLAAGSFRQGCHELASVLRSFYEGLWRESVTVETVGEIVLKGERRTGKEDGGAPGRLFQLLEGFQFGRQEPSADDLESICNLASDVTFTSAQSRGRP